jgi:hypothetical protein
MEAVNLDAMLARFAQIGMIIVVSSSIRRHPANRLIHLRSGLPITRPGSGGESLSSE